MKVFLSWSGHKSHQVAMVLKDWLPLVIQSINPFVSSEDIDKGARWSTHIAKELEDSTFGILCVTKENLEAPWLLFEAGALSKMMDKSAVCPFLFDLKMAEIKEGPILQFQTTVFEKDDIKKLVTALNSSCGDVGLKEEMLNRSFETWWPQLKESLDNIQKDAGSEKSQSKKSTKDDMIEEVLELTRVNQKILRSPDTLLPEEYFEKIIMKCLGKKGGANHRRWISEIFDITWELENRLRSLREFINNTEEQNPINRKEIVSDLNTIIDLVLRQQYSIHKLKNE